MKKHIYLFCLSILILSCTSDNYFIPEDPTLPETDELVTLSFGCGGELINIVNSPMTKGGGSSDDLYLFAFWEHKGGDESQSINWVEYGYIFTDNPSSCIMSFRKNKKYTCDALCIPNGKKLIEHNGNHYGYPFNTPYHEPPVLNKVAYGYHDFMAGFNGCATPKGGNINDLPYNERNSHSFNSIERYFGFKKFMAESDSKIDINLYRMMYSISLNITNFTEGKIILMNKFEISPKDVPFNRVIEMGAPFYMGRIFDEYYGVTNGDFDGCIENYKYDSDFNFQIKYNDKKGNQTMLTDKVIELKRLTNYDISFDLQQVLASDNMGIETNLKNEDITDSGSISL